MSRLVSALRTPLNGSLLVFWSMNLPVVSFRLASAVSEDCEFASSHEQRCGCVPVWGTDSRKLMRSISNLLSLDRVDHHELRYVLLALFGSCRGVDLRLYRYQKQALASYALLLVDAEDHIADVTVSDDFPESELRAILSGVRGKLLERQEIVAGQELLFSIFHSVPGHFSYRDVFQIVPVPEDA